MTFTNAPGVRRGENLTLANVNFYVLPEGYKFNLHGRAVTVPKKHRAAR